MSPLRAVPKAGAGGVALDGRYGCGERDVTLLMADTREAGELRAGYVPGEDCQGADIRARGLAWAQCHWKGAILGDGERGWALIHLPPTQALGVKPKSALECQPPDNLRQGRTPRTTPRLTTK